MSRFARIVIGAGLGVAGLLAAGVALLAWTFSGMGAIRDGLELPGGARVVQDGYTSFAVLDLGGGEVALVDAGNDPGGEAMLAELAARGAGRDDVRAILVTHGHPDHVAACALFPDATTYAYVDELPLLRGEVGSHGPVTRWFAPKPSGCPNLVGVHDGEELLLGARRARMYAVPGHTTGSGAWLVDGVLYLGDSADVSAEGGLLPAKWMFTDDPRQNERALVRLAEKLRAVDVGMIVCAHSGVMEGTELRMWASTR